MKFGDITKHLSGKQQLKEAKTNEDPDRLITSAQQKKLGSTARHEGAARFFSRICNQKRRRIATTSVRTGLAMTGAGRWQPSARRRKAKSPTRFRVRL